MTLAGSCNSAAQQHSERLRALIALHAKVTAHTHQVPPSAALLLHLAHFPQGDRRVTSHILPPPIPLIPARAADEAGARGSTPKHISSPDGKKQRRHLSQKQRASADDVLEMLRLDKSPPRAPHAPPPSAPCPGEVPVDKSTTGEHKVRQDMDLHQSPST